MNNEDPSKLIHQIKDGNGVDWILKDKACREKLVAFLVEQKVLPAGTQPLDPLPSDPAYVVTQDAKFKRYKPYYRLVEGEYVLAVKGTDYEVGADTTGMGTFYEDKSNYTLADFTSTMNAHIAVTNALIPAHSADTVTEGGAS